MIHLPLEDNSKRIRAKDRSFACVEQEPCSCRVNRCERLFGRMLTSTTCASGFLSRAPASPSTPFNPGPQWSELVKHSDVPVDIGQAAFAGNGAR